MNLIFQQYEEYYDEIETKCRKREGLTQQIVDNIDPYGDLPEKVHCFVKCYFEEVGYIDANGYVVERKIKQEFIFDSEKEKIQIFECLQGVGRVKTCADVVKVRDCIFI